MMIDGWPVKVILKGDTAAAGALLPYAGQVAKQMNAAQIPNKTVKVKDATIQIRIDPPAKLFTISIDATDGIKFVSGLVDFVLPAFPVFYDETKPKSQRFGVRRFSPRTVDETPPGETPTGASTIGPDWIDEPLLVRTFDYTQKRMLAERPDLVPWQLFEEENTIQKVNSGMFTGTMRKHVQVMQGLGLKVPFKYHFHISHGIYIQHTDDGKTMPWLIEISAANGIIAGKYPTNHTYRPRTAGYTPEKDPQTELFRQAVDELGYSIANSSNITPRDVVVLMTQAELGAYLEGMQGYAVNEGWAFNYSCTEAQLVCWKWISNSSRKGYRFKVSLTFNDVGEPLSASIGQVEEGYLWGDRVTHFKYYDEAQGGIVSFDLLTSNHEPPEATDITWRVFYDKDDNEVLCKYKRPQQADAVNEFVREGSEFANPGETHSYASGLTRSSHDRMVYVEGHTPDDFITSSFTGVTIERSVGAAEGGPMMYFAGTWWIVCESSASWTVARHSWNGMGFTSRSAGIAPYGNRESVYIYNRNYRFYDSDLLYKRLSYHAVGNTAKAITYGPSANNQVIVIAEPGVYANFQGTGSLYHADKFDQTEGKIITRGAKFATNPVNNGHVWESSTRTTAGESDSTETLFYITGGDKHTLFTRIPSENVGDTDYVAYLPLPGYQSITSVVDGFGDIELCSPEVNETLELMHLKVSEYPTEMSSLGSRFVGLPAKPEQL